MNKDISRSPKKHEFILNLSKSPPLSFDHFEFHSPQPHSKDSVHEIDNSQSFHRDRLMTSTDYISGKNLPISSYIAQNARLHSKKQSVDHQKDSVTYYNSSLPSTTTNAKALNKSSQSRIASRSNTAHQINFLNSKEFAKYALSKVLPKDTKKDKSVLHAELSPQHSRSKKGSLEKGSPKTVFNDESVYHAKLNTFQLKKPKGKQRASNQTSQDSSLLDQTRHINSFISSPQRRNNLQLHLSTTKSTANLRPISTKNQSQTTKNSFQQPSIDLSKRVESSTKTQQAQLSEDTRTKENKENKERHKGMHSIASVLNLKRDKMISPDKNVNSWYTPSIYHRKIASIGSGAQNNVSSFNNSINFSQQIQLPLSQITSVQEERKSSLYRSPSTVSKTSTSPEKRELSAAKSKTGEDAGLKMKDMNVDQFIGFQDTFNNLLDKYKGEIQSAQESFVMLKQVKQAYEVFIKELLTKVEGQKDKERDKEREREKKAEPTQEERELKGRLEAMAKEKATMEEEMKALRSENHRLYTMVSERRPKDMLLQVTDEIREVSSKGGSKMSEEIIEQDIPTQKVVINSESLKQLVLNQQDAIEILKNKEVRLMQLLYAIHKQGFNVEKILQEEAKRSSNRSSDQSRSILGKHIGSIKGSSEGDSTFNGSMGTSGEISGYLMPEPREFGIKQVDALYSLGNTHQALNSMLKSQLKLDFTALPNQKTLKIPNGVDNVEQQPDNAEPLGFHDEFMAKLEEFSLSWRQEALNQRNNSKH